MRPAARKREFPKNVWVYAERKLIQNFYFKVDALKKSIPLIDVSDTNLTFKHACLKKVIQKRKTLGIMA